MSPSGAPRVELILTKAFSISCISLWYARGTTNFPEWNNAERKNPDLFSGIYVKQSQT